MADFGALVDPKVQRIQNMPPPGQSQIAAPQAPNPQQFAPGPPKDEAEMAERVSGWKTFLNALSNDSNLRNSIVTAGATMMQPRTGGQSHAGKIGEGLVAGIQSYESGQDRQQQRELGTEQIKAARTTNRFSEETFDKRIEALNAEVESAKKEPGRVGAVIRLLNAQANSFPDADERKLRYDVAVQELETAKAANSPAAVRAALEKLQAEGGVLRAQSSYYSARAAAAPDEAAAERARAETGTQPAANVQYLNEVDRRIRAARPELSEAQVGALTLEYSNRADPTLVAARSQQLLDSLQNMMLMAQSDPGNPSWAALIQDTQRALLELNRAASSSELFSSPPVVGPRLPAGVDAAKTDPRVRAIYEAKLKEAGPGYDQDEEFLAQVWALAQRQVSGTK
jgi:hypothetical protein